MRLRVHPCTPLYIIGGRIFDSICTLRLFIREGKGRGGVHLSSLTRNAQRICVHDWTSKLQTFYLPVLQRKHQHLCSTVMYMISEPVRKRCCMLLLSWVSLLNHFMCKCFVSNVNTVMNSIFRVCMSICIHTHTDANTVIHKHEHVHKLCISLSSDKNAWMFAYSIYGPLLCLFTNIVCLGASFLTLNYFRQKWLGS